MTTGTYGSDLAPGAPGRTGERDVATNTVFKRATLLALRVTTGFLLIWWGLNKIVSTGLSMTISDTFYGGLFSADTLQYGFGAVQTAVGALVVLGLFRRVVLPIQAAINAAPTAAVWYAIIDPFNWYLGNERAFPYTQLFYPSAIILAASLLLIAFRDQDRLALDNRASAERP